MIRCIFSSLNHLPGFFFLPKGLLFNIYIYIYIYIYMRWIISSISTYDDTKVELIIWIIGLPKQVILFRGEDLFRTTPQFFGFEFLCFMAYHLLRVIECQSQPHRRTVAELFNSEFGNKEMYTFTWGISSKINVTARLEIELATTQRGTSLISFGWAHNRRILHQYATDSPELSSLAFEFNVFPSTGYSPRTHWPCR